MQSPQNCSNGRKALVCGRRRTHQRRLFVGRARLLGGGGQPRLVPGPHLWPVSTRSIGMFTAHHFIGHYNEPVASSDFYAHRVAEEAVYGTSNPSVDRSYVRASLQAASAGL